MMLLSLMDQFVIVNTVKGRLLIAGDIHLHPGPFELGLKFCYWNLNGIAARNKIKIPLMEAYNTIFHCLFLHLPLTKDKCGNILRPILMKFKIH